MQERSIAESRLRGKGRHHHHRIVRTVAQELPDKNLIKRNSVVFLAQLCNLARTFGSVLTLNFCGAHFSRSLMAVSRMYISASVGEC